MFEYSRITFGKNKEKVFTHKHTARINVRAVITYYYTALQWIIQGIGKIKSKNANQMIISLYSALIFPSLSTMGMI